MREKENMGNGNPHADANALTFINKLGLDIMLTCTETHNKRLQLLSVKIINGEIIIYIMEKVSYRESTGPFGAYLTTWDICVTHFLECLMFFNSKLICLSAKTVYSNSFILLTFKQ
jgi:hypothetical protein